MSRRYTEQQQRLILEQLIANAGDVILTSQQTGVPERTLARWKNQSLPQIPGLPLPPPPPQTASPISPDDIQYPILQPGEMADRMRHLQEKMMANADLLNESVAPAIAEATLAQRVAALAQLTDRIIRLNAQLPQPEAKPDPNADDGTYEMLHPVEDFDDEEADTPDSA